MKIRYFIKPRAKDLSKDVKVYVSLRKGDFRKEVATTLLIKPDCWYAKGECTRNNGTVPYRSEKEEYLSNLRELLLSRQAVITSGKCDVKKVIREFSSGVKDNDGFWGQWDEFIEMKARTVTQSRIDKFNSLKSILKKYEEINAPVTWSMITIDWHADFEQYCMREGKTINTIWTYIQALKAYLNHALIAGWHTNTEFKKIKPKEEVTPQFALTTCEIDKLIEYEPKSDRLLKVRDSFLIGCFTAARYRDWPKIKLSGVLELDGISYIRYVDSKTHTNIAIPAHKKLLEVLNRNPNGINTISNQKFNDGIKMVAFEAKLTRIVERGNDVASIYELISTHVARRTAATILVNKGVDYKTIMKLTGHKKLETFLRYVRIDDVTHLKTISKAFEW